MKFNPVKEKKLVAAIRKGNRQAAEELIEQFKPLVSHIVHHAVHRADMHEDLCQEVFIRIFRNLNNWRGDARLSTWIGRISYNHCINFLRSRPARMDESHTPMDELELAGPEEHSFPANDMNARIRAEVDRLTQPYGVILFLYHFQDFSYQQIGATLDLPEGTVKNYLFRARKQLRERLLKQFTTEELSA